VTRPAHGLAVLTLVAASAASPQARPGAGAPPAGWQAFTRAFDAYAVGDSVVGASVLVMRDGRVLAQHDFGFADRAARQPVDERTLFHWGSITKTLTAVAVMQLRDRGKLSLDDRVTRYLPELRQVHDTFGSIDDITIRMLLSHTAGFQNPTWPYKAGKAWEPFEPTRWEQLVAMLPYQEIAFRPGSRYSYSNPAFIYLARVVEQLTGDPYEGYVYKNLWAPLGMTRSYFGATPYHLAEWRSNNYDVVRDSSGRESIVANGRDFDPGITIPNGGWNAPLGDVARWVAFLTGARGAAMGDTILARSSLVEMWRTLMRTVDEAPGDSVTTNDAHDAESGRGFAAIRDAALDLIAR
jgi:CubicO group peptidase (beta-lactamase class C family)